MPTARSARRLPHALAAVALLLLVLAHAAPASAHRDTPPKVPACFSDVGICDGVPIKAPIGFAKLTSAPKGVFKLTGPSPLQTTKPVACGDLGCIFNHLDWHIGLYGGARFGCEINTTKCTVAVSPGADAWLPVVVTQNDFPVAAFLLWSPAGARTISGKITATECSSDSGNRCKVDSPLAGASVRAKGPHGSGSATTGADGKYKITVPHGNGYVVTPSYKDVRFAPSHREIGVTEDVGGIDFRAKAACEDDDADSRSVAVAASSDNPCQRLYNIKVSAWVPYTSVADPFSGALNADGTGYPESAKSLFATVSGGYLAGDAYPPCLGDQVLKTFADTRPDLLWRSRFLGSGVQTPPASGGMGTVDVPIAWSGTKHKATFRSPSVTPGVLRRQYDYQLGDSQGSCRTPISRTVTPTVRTNMLSADRFVIELSWPIPYAAFEDLGDVKDFKGATIGAINTQVQKNIDEKLNDLPGYKVLPAAIKSKFKAYIVDFAAKAGGEAAIALAKSALKNVSSFLTDKTPPPIKLGKKALDILKKASYGSADVRITGSFSTLEGIPHFLAGQTTMKLETESDAFPSFGLSVSRRGQTIPWNGDQSSTVTKGNFPDAYGALPNVINDSVSETGVESYLQGGPGIERKIIDHLDNLRNTTPPLLRAFLPPLLIGSPGGQRDISWVFPGGRS